MFQLPSAKPHDMGIPPEAVTRLLQSLEERHWGLHSFILVRHGYSVVEKWVLPYTAERPHLLYSLTKSFTSTAVGFAVQEGLCALDDHLVDFYPDLLECEPCGHTQKLRIRHLLSMATGHSAEPAHPPVKLVENFLKSYIDHEPGSHFLYNTYASNVLGCLVEKLSGQSLDDYLSSRLFAPLGFGEHHWQRSPEGNCYGGFGLSLQSRDIAKFGQFILQKGRWGGRQILNAEWIEEATSEHIRQGGEGDADWHSGYGYQFWRCDYPGAFRADGAFGQYCVIFPKQDMVVAMTAGTEDMGAALKLLYEILLPALSEEALPYDEDAQTQLSALAFSIPKPQGAADSPLTEALDGAIYRLHNGERLCVSAGDTNTLHWRHEGMSLAIPLSSESWAYGGAHDPGNPHAEYLSAAAWKSENCLSLTLVHYNTPTVARYEIRFIDRAVHIREHKNRLFAPPEQEYFGIQESCL